MNTSSLTHLVLKEMQSEARQPKTGNGPDLASKSFEVSFNQYPALLKYRE